MEPATDPALPVDQPAGPAANMGIDISVVVPLYGCTPFIEELCRRLRTTLSRITNRYEIILVDDCGPDDAWPFIQAQAARMPEIHAIRLSRNFGQHVAIGAGLSVSRGAWIVVLDGDLQDPPEEIARLYEQVGERGDLGVDVVFARRRRRSETLSRRIASRAYFRLLSALSDSEIDGREGSLSLFSRKVADAYLAISDQDRHHIMLLRWLGFRQVTIEYDQDPRKEGSSSYTLGKLIDTAVRGLFFTSTRLLRVIVYTGILSSLLGFFLAVIIIVQYFMHDIAPGWTSLAVIQLVVGGAVIVCVGTVGMYVGRIFDQVRGRPLFVIDRTIRPDPIPPERRA
jgi:polyisoprenyl-phosphate glycosyltransferase